MKKILFALMLVLVLGITGCTSESFLCNFAPNYGSCQEEYVPITNDTEGIIQSLGTLSVLDEAEDFDVALQTLHTFRHLDNEDILYVDIEEFLYVMKEPLVPYRISTDEKMKISYTVNYSGTLFGGYEYYMEIDSDEHTIFYNDFNFGGSLNTTTGFDYDTDLRVVDSEYIESDVTKTIDLDDYNILMAREGDTFFIPLYLANLLFTGDSLNVYQVEGYLYVTDDFYEAQSILYGGRLKNDINEQNLIDNTINYTALFFDYFYGLKEFQEVTSYKDEFQTRGFYDVTTLEELDVLLQEFIYDLNDLHSSVVAFGYNENYVPIVTPSEDNKLWDLYDVYLGDVCSIRDIELELREFETYYILELNEFTLDTVTLLKEELVDIDPTKPIYIDLACNVGGNLVAVFELFMYMSSDPVEFRYTNPSTGELFSEQYQLETSRALENDFYIFTSAATFSAANLTVSMARDNNLAKIFGTPSSGGACAIIYNVLPNNMVITYSSQFAMVDKNNQLIEAGVTPDFVIDYSDSLELTLDYLAESNGIGVNEYFAGIFADTEE